jgi:hypothetical protein
VTVDIAFTVRSPLEDEEAVALFRWCERPQLLVPGEDVPDQRRRLERGVTFERASLQASGAGLEPHQRLAVLQQGDLLQAVAREFGDGLGVAGRVDHDGQVVRQQRDGTRVQAGLDLLGAAPPSHRQLQRMVAAPLQLEAAGHDAAEATIDLGKKPTQRADLVAIGSALRGGRCARFPASQRCLLRKHAGWREARVPAASRVRGRRGPALERA